MSNLNENYFKMNPLIKNIMRTYKRSDYKFENIKPSRKNDKTFKINTNSNNKNNLQESLMQKANELHNQYLLRTAQKTRDTKSSTVSLVASVKEKLEKMPSFCQTRSIIPSRDYRFGITRAEANKFASITLENKSNKPKGKTSIENTYAIGSKKIRKILTPEKTNITFNNSNGPYSYKNLHTLNKTSATKLLENSKNGIKLQKFAKPVRVVTPRTPIRNWKYQTEKITEMKASGLVKSMHTTSKILTKALAEDKNLFNPKITNISGQSLKDLKKVPLVTVPLKYYSGEKMSRNGFVEYIRRTRNIK